MTLAESPLDESTPAHWPLPEAGIRQMTSNVFQERLRVHPLSCDIYPIAMGFYPKAHGHRMRHNAHDSYLFIYCSAGKARLMVNDENYEVSRGDAILLPPGMPHDYRANAEAPWTIHWVRFRGEKSDALSRFLNFQAGPNAIGLNSGLIAKFNELLNIRKQGLSLKDFVQAASHLKMLLCDVAICALKHRERLSAHMEMSELQEYMQDHMDRDLDLQELAQLANMSKYHFIRRFKESTGQTPIHYFIQLKMERACQLLDTTDATVKSIAAQLGFSDPLYFSRQFRKVTGSSPQTYRKTHTT